MLEIKSLIKGFDGKTVLQAISLFLSASDTAVILGPSGSGKSTLLRIIAGLEKADSGLVLLDNQPLVFDKRMWPRLGTYRQNKVGLVFQDLKLLPHLNCLDNCLLGLEDNPRAEEAIQEGALKLGVSQILNKRPAEISRGEAQRVALLRSLVRVSTILLLDEPTSSLDADSRKSVVSVLQRASSPQRRVTLIATHDLRLAQMMGNRVFYLADGILQEIAKSKINALEIGS